MPTLVLVCKFNPAEITIICRDALKDSTIEALNRAVPLLTTTQQSKTAKAPRLEMRMTPVRHYHLRMDKHYCDHTARSYMFLQFFEALECEDEEWKLRSMNTAVDPEQDKDITMFFFSREL
eukprot:TRINITY_DN2615_c0_g1_i2.p3 TRINITY_DN2615_c0_g1~~TRINITY_DN2615_c0_g1_i2.p3  ORF type:complete len:121 (-),score=26.51 TRINITY_DN2615_c0_g1_i2:432-794(-)